MTGSKRGAGQHNFSFGPNLVGDYFLIAPQSELCLGQRAFESRSSFEDVLTYSVMRVPGLFLAIVLLGSTCLAAGENSDSREPRQRVAAAFPDGVLVFRANSALDLTVDGFRQGSFDWAAAAIPLALR